MKKLYLAVSLFSLLMAAIKLPPALADDVGKGKVPFMVDLNSARNIMYDATGYCDQRLRSTTVQTQELYMVPSAKLAYIFNEILFLSTVVKA